MINITNKKLIFEYNILTEGSMRSVYQIVSFHRIVRTENICNVSFKELKRLFLHFLSIKYFQILLVSVKYI